MPRHLAVRAAKQLASVVAGLLVPALVTGAQQVVIAPTPIVVQSDRYEILVVTHRSVGTLTDDERLGALIASCRRRMKVVPPDSAAAVGRRAWDWSGGPSADPLVVTLVVIPSEPLFTACADAVTQQMVAPARALRISADSTYDRQRDVERVTFWRGQERVVTLLSERATILRLTPGGARTTGAGAVRFSVPIESLAPDSTGARSDLRLEVWNPRDTVPELIPVPWTVIAEAWHEVLEWRAAAALSRAPAVGAAGTSARLVTPVPRDSALRVARTRYLGGDLAGANAALIPRLSPGALRRDDYRNARVQLALTLASVEDTSAARVLLGRVVADEPCFALTSAAPEYARRVMAGLQRPATRCTSAPLLRTALLSTVLPGFGRPATPTRNVLGAAAAVVIGAALASGFSKSSEARNTYDQYLAVDYSVTSNPIALSRELYEKAETLRATAKKQMTIGVVVWGATVVESLWHEARLARYLAGIREYGVGTPRGLSLVPRAAVGQLGLSLTFF